MKLEPVCACIFLGLSLLRLPVLGQDAATARPAASPAAVAAAVAEQQGMDEKFKQLAADIDTLRAANQLLITKVSALQDELQQVHAEQARLAASAVTRDALLPLAQKIEEEDKKRMEDKDVISDQIKTAMAQIEKTLNEKASTPAVDPSPRSPTHSAAIITPASAPPAASDGFSYTIKEGDLPGDILKAYNSDFKSKGLKTITLKQLRDANPGVDWNRLKVGQKIIIPRPAGYPPS
jgi:hypothetical protein